MEVGGIRGKEIGQEVLMVAEEKWNNERGGVNGGRGGSGTSGGASNGGRGGSGTSGGFSNGMGGNRSRDGALEDFNEAFRADLGSVATSWEQKGGGD
ncbi:hypothetical protein SUGI_1024950 [Cryptomeria japonica]|nr:hypothetical protein SUGI_1024950 [Cryptomeria japonica]